MLLKFTAGDIIKRATQIADMENTDFISDYEKLALLNENWQILYQKLIDAGDRSYIKQTTDVYDGMDLPIDFYQLANLYIKEGHDPVYKRNGVQTKGYDISHGQIHISKDYASIPLVMEYYKAPPALTLRGKSTEVNFPDGILSANHDKYIYKSGSTYYLHSGADNDISFYLPSTVDSKLFGVFDNGILAYIEGKMYANKDELTSSGSIEMSVIGSTPIIIDNKVYFYSPQGRSTTGTSTIYDWYDVPQIEMDLSLPEGTIIVYASPDLSRMYALAKVTVNGTTAYGCYANASNDGGQAKFVQLDGEITLNNRYIGDYLYALTSIGHMYKCGPEYAEDIDIHDNIVAIVNDEYVYTTGYYGNTDTKHLEGYIEDTILDAPNNLYFTVIAYALAISFMSKQGNDTTQVAAIYDAAYQQLIDSISNDVNANYQMKDVYSHKFTGVL